MLIVNIFSCDTNMGFVKLPTAVLVCDEQLLRQMELLICGWILTLRITDVLNKKPQYLLFSRQIFNGINELMPPFEMYMFVVSPWWEAYWKLTQCFQSLFMTPQRLATWQSLFIKHNWEQAVHTVYIYIYMWYLFILSTVRESCVSFKAGNRICTFLIG